MSLHAIEALVPEDIESWRQQRMKHNGRVSVTARRNGITFVVNFDGRWWSVSKLHGGKETAFFQSTRVPERVEALAGPIRRTPRLSGGRMTEDNTIRIDGSQPGDDILMMKTPDLWPLGPVLPLVRGEECGILTRHAELPRWRVYKVNLYETRLRSIVQGSPRDDIEVEDYEDAEGVRDAGWRVS